MSTPPALRAKVLKMHADGKNYYEIQLATGLARSTCARICGKFQRAGKRRPPKNVGPVIEEPDMSVTIWCDVCRAHIHPPCVACHVRRIVAARKIKP